LNPPEPDRPFDAPWQAQVFAMTLALHARGAFSWPDWTRALGAQLALGAPDGSDYWDCWVVALERMVAAQGQAS
jgi:nitrile hydratase accessory protein